MKIAVRISGVMALALLAAASYAKTIVVNNNGSNTGAPCSTATQSTVNGALALAAPGDTIEVCPGIYTESIHITFPLSLTGVPGKDSTRATLRPSGPTLFTDNGGSTYGSPENTSISPVIFVDSAEDVNITLMSIDGSLDPSLGCDGINHVGIYYFNSTGTVKDSAVGWSGLNADGSLTGCQEGHGVYVDSSLGGHATLTVRGTSVHDFDKSGIDAFGNGTTLITTDDYVTGAGPTTATAQNGIEVIYGAKGTNNSDTVSSVDYTPTTSSATGILFYEAADGGEASTNIISETNGAVYFDQSNKGIANYNSISKSVNYSALGGYQSNNTTFKSNTIYGTANVIYGQPAIYICGSKNSATDNLINDALIGIQQDVSSADGCSGYSGSTVSGNKYKNVGIDTQVLSDTYEAARSQRATGLRKPSPSK